jgi:hypothetical protein
VIPADRYAEIDWKNWDFSRGTLTAGYFKQQLFINPEALSAIPTLDEAGFYKAFVAYIEKTGAPPRIIKGDSTTIRGSSWADDYQADLKTFSHGLADIVNPASSKIAIFNDFKTMQTVSLWRERGIGFIQSIIPQTFTGSMVSYEMTFSARGVDPIHYKFGTFVNEELYKSLMYIQNIINDRSFDLRLLTENGELKQVKQDVP